MGCLIIAGINFYMLAEGESYPTPNIGNNYSVSYVVFLTKANGSLRSFVKAVVG